jgi:hypothetical protein
MPTDEEIHQNIIEGRFEDLLIKQIPGTNTFLLDGLFASKETEATILDKHFAEEDEKSDNNVRKAKLIDAFEIHYSEYRESSEWYQRIKGSITAIRRAADEERKEIEQKRTAVDYHDKWHVYDAWRRTLAETLEKLKPGHFDIKFDWRDLASRFNSIPGQDKKTALSLTIAGLCIEPVCQRKERSENDPAIETYQSLAKIAQAALGYPEDGEDGLTAWHIRLILNSSRFHKAIDGGGWIDSLAQASAQYCETLESEAYKLRRRDAEANTEKPESKPPKINSFPEMPNLKWEEIVITFISNDSIRIQARNSTKITHYVDMGFRDKRKGDLPTKAWDFLKNLAENGGEISYSGNSYNSKNKIRAKELRKILRNYFKIEADPFYQYKKCGAYKTIFGLKENN